jgi:hypothetical protein
MSQRAAYIVATGKSRYSYLMSQRAAYIVATGKSKYSYLMSQRAAYIVATGKSKYSRNVILYLDLSVATIYAALCDIR